MHDIPKNFKEIKSLITSGQLTCGQLVSQYLENINEQKDLNVFITVFDKQAIERAREIDEKIKSGNAGKLAGMVVSVKDVISVEDSLLTCGSKILSNFETLYNATVIDRLLKEDAIIIGKTNCDEFAMGSSNENSFYGPVKNPIDKTRVPGG